MQRPRHRDSNLPKRAPAEIPIPTSEHITQQKDILDEYASMSAEISELLAEVDAEIPATPEKSTPSTSAPSTPYYTPMGSSHDSQAYAEVTKSERGRGTQGTVTTSERPKLKLDICSAANGNNTDEHSVQGRIDIKEDEEPEPASTQQQQRQRRRQQQQEEQEEEEQQEDVVADEEAEAEAVEVETNVEPVVATPTAIPWCFGGMCFMTATLNTLRFRPPHAQPQQIP